MRLRERRERGEEGVRRGGGGVGGEGWEERGEGRGGKGGKRRGGGGAGTGEVCEGERGAGPHGHAAGTTTDSCPLLLLCDSLYLHRPSSNATASKDLNC